MLCFQMDKSCTSLQILQISVNFVNTIKTQENPVSLLKLLDSAFSVTCLEQNLKYLYMILRTDLLLPKGKNKSYATPVSYTKSS